MLYHFEVHLDSDGYWTECIELEGCVSQGSSLEELKSNAKEALDLYLEEPEESSSLPPLPDSRCGSRGDILEVALDPGIALSLLLRRYRRQYQLTQKEMSERLGMKNLYSYQRLERRSNPRLEMLRRLRRVFPDLSVDYLLQE